MPWQGAAKGSYGVIEDFRAVAFLNQLGVLYEAKVVPQSHNDLVRPGHTGFLQFSVIRLPHEHSDYFETSGLICVNQLLSPSGPC
jgi:hypothetical protein